MKASGAKKSDSSDRILREIREILLRIEEYLLKLQPKKEEKEKGLLHG
jgi:hypothetical protein|tara:strand:- start:423 stop:566 length:144 start_codon:yes stop_codon:yes gene_type:complete